MRGQQQEHTGNANQKADQGKIHTETVEERRKYNEYVKQILALIMCAVPEWERESVEELLSEMDLHRFYWPKHSVQIFLQMQIVSGGLWFKVKERNGIRFKWK